MNQVHSHVGVVARHDHLGALGELNSASHVRGTEVELGAVVGEERLVAATLILLEDVDLALEVGVGGCLLYTSPSPRDLSTSRMPSSA